MIGWIRDLEASGDVRAEMCERECANGDEFLTRGLQCSAQGRAGVCVRGWFLTQGLQCSAQGFAGASGDGF